MKLITKGSIEEDMLRLGETKLALDEAVAGDTEESDGKAESAPEKMMRTSLLETLRKQFEEEGRRERKRVGGACAQPRTGEKN